MKFIEKSYVVYRCLLSFFWTSRNRYPILKEPFACSLGRQEKHLFFLIKDISLWA